MQFKYLLSKNYLVKIIIFLLLSVLLSVPLYSQIIIKETVKINPDEKKGILSKGLSTNSVLSVMIISEASHWKAEVTGPCGASGLVESDNNSTSGSINIANPPAAKYRVSLSQYFAESGGNAHISYIATYSGDAYFYRTGDAGQSADGPGVRTTDLEFDLEFFNDFTFSWSDYICGSKIISAPTVSLFCNKDCPHTTSLASPDLQMIFNISGGPGDLVFCNDTGYILGTRISIPINEYSGLKLKLRTPYYGNTTNAVLTCEMNGIVKSTEVTINPSSKIFQLKLFEPEGFYDPLSAHLTHGMKKEFIVKSEGEGECNLSSPESSAKFNVTITEGARFGKIKDIKSGLTGTTLQNLSHTDGLLLLQFAADGDIPESEERIVIHVSSNDTDISPLDIEYYIHPNDIKVAFSPPSIKQNDTSDVILKFKDTDGS